MTLLTKPSVMFGQVMHKRFRPKVNGFHYGIYYIALPLSRLGELPMPHNRFGFLSFHDRDHGGRDGGNPGKWARGVLRRFGITSADGEIVLIAMPRVLGYVFNPVSFWLCHDKGGKLRAVLCEVNNTFGETHTYICARAHGRAIGKGDTVTARKLFHVSPFLERTGHYRFGFDIGREKIRITIDHYDSDGKMLATALTGRFAPMNRTALRRAFWRYPLVTLKAILLIHAQAVKLALKGVKFVPRPRQKRKRISRAVKITDL